MHTVIHLDKNFFIKLNSSDEILHFQKTRTTRITKRSQKLRRRSLPFDDSTCSADDKRFALVEYQSVVTGFARRISAYYWRGVEPFGSSDRWHAAVTALD